MIVGECPYLYVRAENQILTGYFQWQLTGLTFGFSVGLSGELCSLPCGRKVFPTCTISRKSLVVTAEGLF